MAESITLVERWYGPVEIRLLKYSFRTRKYTKKQLKWISDAAVICSASSPRTIPPGELSNLRQSPDQDRTRVDEDRASMLEGVSQQMGFSHGESPVFSASLLCVHRLYGVANVTFADSLALDPISPEIFPACQDYHLIPRILQAMDPFKQAPSAHEPSPMVIRSSATG